MELPGISHRESEQTFHDAGQFLELIVEYTKSLAVFLRASGLRKQQFRLAVKHCEWRAQLVRGVGYKLA